MVGRVPIESMMLHKLACQAEAVTSWTRALELALLNQASRLTLVRLWVDARMTPTPVRSAPNTLVATPRLHPVTGAV